MIARNPKLMRCGVEEVFIRFRWSLLAEGAGEPGGGQGGKLEPIPTEPYIRIGCHAIFGLFQRPLTARRLVPKGGLVRRLLTLWRAP